MKYFPVVWKYSGFQNSQPAGKRKTPNLGPISDLVLPNESERPMFDNQVIWQGPSCAQLRERLRGPMFESAKAARDDEVEEFSCSSDEETADKRVVEGASSSEDQSAENKLPRLPQKTFLDSSPTTFCDVSDYHRVSTSKSQAQRDMHLIAGEVSSELKFKILERLAGDVEKDKSLAVVISTDNAVKKVDIFDAFTTLARRIVRHPNDVIHQDCLLKYLELLHSVVEVTAETHKNYILKRIQDSDLNGKLIRFCSEKKCNVILSEDQCDQINKKLSNLAQHDTLAGFFSLPESNSELNKFYDSFERCLQSPVKIPPGLLLSGTEFYAKVQLESYESSLPVKLCELVSDVINLSSQCDDGECDACQIGYIRLFANGFALVSKTSRKLFDERRLKIARKIKKLESTLLGIDNSTFELGQMVCVPDRMSRGVLLNINEGKKYLVYLLDEGTIVKTDKILNYPTDWPSKPLLVFAKVQGLVRDNLELKNAAARILNLTFTEDAFGQVPYRGFVLEDMLIDLFQTGKEHIQLFSLRCLKIIWKQHQDFVLEDSRKQLSISTDTSLCLKIAHFLRFHPHCEDAIIVLYYMLNIMQEKKMKLVFEQSGLESFLTSIPEISTADKLLRLYTEGNYWTKHQQRRIVEKPRPVPICSPVRRSEVVVQENQGSPMKNQGSNFRPRGPRFFSKSFATLTDDPSALEQALLYGDEQCFKIKDRTLELFDVVKDHSNPVKDGTIIEATAEFDDIFLERTPSQEILGQQIVALLNSSKQGRIFIGVRETSVVQGIFMDRARKDLFRQDFDQTLKSKLVPNLTMLPDNCPLESPEFHPVENGKSDYVIIKIIVRPALTGMKAYEWKGSGIFRRQNGKTIKVTK